MLQAMRGHPPKKRKVTYSSSRLTPIFDLQSRNPIEMRRIAGNQHAAYFERRSGNDEVCIIARMATRPSHCPQVGRPNQDRKGHGRYIGIARGSQEVRQLFRGTSRHHAADNFIERDRRKRQTTVLIEVLLCVCQDTRVLGLEDLGEHVGIEQRLVHLSKADYVLDWRAS
jgi:hypothetical protein